MSKEKDTKDIKDTKNPDANREPEVLKTFDMYRFMSKWSVIAAIALLLLALAYVTWHMIFGQNVA